jgi:hypothetical protein
MPGNRHINAKPKVLAEELPPDVVQSESSLPERLLDGSSVASATRLLTGGGEARQRLWPFLGVRRRFAAKEPVEPCHCLSRLRCKTAISHTDRIE